MDIVSVIASVIVGIAFLVAGGSKLVAGPEWRQQAAGLGAPVWIAPVVPWVEIAIGAALVAQLARPWPALAAFVLLLAFTGLIAVNLARGRRPPCACFGAWSATPIGPRHLIRNVVLIALSLIAFA